MIFRRHLFKNLPHPRHGDFGEIVAHPPGVKPVAKILHDFPTLCLAECVSFRFEARAYVLHGRIVHEGSVVVYSNQKQSFIHPERGAVLLSGPRLELRVSFPRNESEDGCECACERPRGCNSRVLQVFLHPTRLSLHAEDSAVSIYPSARYSLSMARMIVQKEHPALRAVAQEIPKSEIGSARLRTLIAEMKKLLAKEEYGVALAAPQVGESLRLFVVSGSAVTKRERTSAKRDVKNESSPQATSYKLQANLDQVYINPILTKLSRGKKEKHEGCLSVRGKWGMVPRAEKATITAYDEHGKKFTRGASGLLAHIFQHEMDHLDGVLYIDKATELYDEEESSKTQ